MASATLPRSKYIAQSALGAFYFFYTFDYIKNHHYTLHRVRGSSMAPLLSPHDSETAQRDFVLFKQNVRLADDYAVEGGSGDESELKRGMIVSFLSPFSSKMAVKRVVALEGDVVKPLGRHNSSTSSEGHDSLVSEIETGIVVPFGHVWVEGDQVDREKNLDSNNYGPISKSLIRGVGLRIVWPLERSGKIDWEKDWEEKCRGRITRAKEEHQIPEEWRLY